MIMGNAKYIAKIKDGIRRFHCEENQDSLKHDWEYFNGAYKDSETSSVLIWRITLVCRNCGDIRVLNSENV